MAAGTAKPAGALRSGPRDMPIELQDTPLGVTKAILSGRIDFANVQAIEAPLCKAVESGGAMVIDLSAVEFIASLGLRTLIKCARTMNNKRGKLALLSPRPMVAEIIQISGIEDLIPVYHSEAEAVAFVSPG